MSIVYITLGILLILSLGLNIYLIYFRENVTPGQTVSYPETSEKSPSEEEYVWIATMTSIPMYVNHDQKALKQFAKNMGVKVTVEGPKHYDVPGQVAAIEEVIKRKPDGIMVLGMERGLIPMVNKAVEAGIPTKEGTFYILRGSPSL